MFQNPAAAGGRSRLGAATAILARHFDLAVHDTEKGDALHEKAAREARDGCGLLIAAGGDGTINLIVNALAGTGAALGVLPLGTANDFAQNAGIPRDAVAAAQRIVAGAIRRVDVLAANGRRFCTVGGMGLVTDCAMSANRIKSPGHPLRPGARYIGSAIYPVVAGARILFGGNCTWDISLAWTGPARESSPPLRAAVHGIFLANQRMIGGMLLPADSRNDDGIGEICVMAAGHRLQLLNTLLALRMDRPIDRRVMGIHRASRARIESEVELGFMGDGELLCRGRQFELEVIPGGLPVRH